MGVAKKGLFDTFLSLLAPETSPADLFGGVKAGIDMRRAIKEAHKSIDRQNETLLVALRADHTPGVSDVMRKFIQESS